MQQYLDLMRYVKENGVRKGDRTGVGTLSVFGYQMRFDLAEGFPAVTTKKLHFRSIIHELLWFLRGETNIGYLKENKVRIWDEWADENGDLGPVYGHQWRSWPTPDGRTIDQMAQLVDQLCTNPDSRRLIVTAWNPADLEKMALAPCHCLFQFYVANGRLSCQLYQRSADIFLGVPFNIASYALLTMMIAQVTGYQPGEFIHTFGDAHLYLNHLSQAEEQLSRAPFPRPQMKLNPAVDSLFGFGYDDLSWKGTSRIPGSLHLSRFSPMQISMIAALAPGRVIGRDNTIPWRLPADMKRFKAITMGKPIIMGRKTYESIGRPLPGRMNIVVSRNPTYEAPGCTVVHSPSAALTAAGAADEVMIIGGSHLYETFLPRADRLYLTFIDQPFPGDIYFPAWKPEEWQEVSREEGEINERNRYPYRFVVLERVESG